MNVLQSKTELLFLFLVVHLGNWSYGQVPDVVESQVKSWEVERRSSSTDFFTVYMKPTFRCFAEWCAHRFNATFFHTRDYSYCSCTCSLPESSFLPSMRRCINARMAARFAGNLVRRSFFRYNQRTHLRRNLFLVFAKNNCQYYQDIWLHHIQPGTLL